MKAYCQNAVRSRIGSLWRMLYREVNPSVPLSRQLHLTWPALLWTPRRLPTLRLNRGFLLKAFEEMAYCGDPHRRWYLLEDLLVRTFQLHQIDVFRSFKRNDGSEQIDAAFKLEGWHYLVECRWREKLADTRQVDGLRGQVQRSGKQTMGVFLAINGWSSHVPGNLKQNPDKSVLLMDGYDLRVVLEGRVGLRELLFSKLKHFNIEGEPFVSVAQIIADRA